jgi:hypothetical protein
VGWPGRDCSAPPNEKQCFINEAKKERFKAIAIASTLYKSSSINDNPSGKTNVKERRGKREEKKTQ